MFFKNDRVDVGIYAKIYMNICAELLKCGIKKLY